MPQTKPPLTRQSEALFRRVFIALGCAAAVSGAAYGLKQDLSPQPGGATTPATAPATPKP